MTQKGLRFFGGTFGQMSFGGCNFNPFAEVPDWIEKNLTKTIEESAEASNECAKVFVRCFAEVALGLTFDSLIEAAMYETAKNLASWGLKTGVSTITRGCMPIYGVYSGMTTAYAGYKCIVNVSKK